MYFTIDILLYLKIFSNKFEKKHSLNYMSYFPYVNKI